MSALCETLAEFACALRDDPARLPCEVRRRATERLLDNLGCMTFGHEVAPARATVELAAAYGLGPCRVVGLARPTSPTESAFANGVLAQSFELNDLGAYVHPGACVVPACLAALDLAPKPVSGARFVAALAVGYETTVRLSESVGAEAELTIGWHTPGFHGAVGAAAAAGALLGVSPPTLAHALAIAADLAGGGLMLARLGTDAKRLHCGRGAQTGVLAVLLAQRGLAARLDVLEHPTWSYARAVSGGHAEADHSKLLDGLGTRFTAFDRTAIKYYPVGAEVLGVIDSLSHLKREHGFGAADVTGIEVRTASFFYRAQAHAFPASVSQLHFATEYGAAMAVLHDIRAIHEDARLPATWMQGMHDLQVRRLAGLVVHVPDEAMDRRNPYAIDSAVEVRLADGRALRAETAYVRDEQSRATMRFATMDVERIARKFVALVAARVPSGPAAELAAGILALDSGDAGSALDAFFAATARDDAATV